MSTSIEVLEAKKLEVEIQAIRDERKRRWLVSISLVVGVLGTLISAVNILSNISRSYDELALNTRMQTTKIFLSEITPLIKSDNPLVGEALRESSYHLSSQLAEDYTFLSAPVFSLLCASSDSGDGVASKVLEARGKEGECK
ncbi:hypothetical protein [Vibrio variabilis]|uniref:hypothetical protein n=1 Tax=Vibrio variabilis TaxID=990271 RepID=UPI000DD95627|nr:hypothetical protein [Vibrio variabilis]